MTMAPEHDVPRNEAGMTTRERDLNAAFVGLTDTLVQDFDVTDLMYRLAATCVEILGGDEAGILLVDGRERLRVMGSSSEQLRLLELFEVQSEQGPCLDAYQDGVAVHDPDLAVEGPWPLFRARATSNGYRSVDALPMRLRDSVIGALNVLCYHEGGLDERDRAAAQALADVATIALLQERAATESQTVAEHLRRALDGQVVVEQAKGMLAERTGLSVGEAFELMRGFARSHNRRVVEVATAVTEGRLAHTAMRTDVDS